MINCTRSRNAESSTRIVIPLRRGKTGGEGPPFGGILEITEKGIRFWIQVIVKGLYDATHAADQDPFMEGHFEEPA